VVVVQFDASLALLAMERGLRLKYLAVRAEHVQFDPCVQSFINDFQIVELLLQIAWIA
jgi:hypothetical protein